MDVNGVLTAVSSVGFPIVACIYMAYVNNNQTDAHKEEMNKVTEALADLKIVITELKDKLTQ